MAPRQATGEVGVTGRPASPAVGSDDGINSGVRRAGRSLNPGCVGLSLTELSLSVLVPARNDLAATCGRHEATPAGEGSGDVSDRTVLEQRVYERRQTLEAYVGHFVREHGELLGRSTSGACNGSCSGRPRCEVGSTRFGR